VLVRLRLVIADRFMLSNCYCCYCLTNWRLRYVVISSSRGTDEDGTAVSYGGVTFVPLFVKTGSEVVNGWTHSYTTQPPWRSHEPLLYL
jgi:hypothetical protein